MRFCASLLSVALFCLAGCGQQETADYGFRINGVAVSSAYQALDVRVQQALQLSEQAREALEHGVTLTISLELELRSDANLIVARHNAWRYQLRYLPLNERYLLSDETTGELRVFSRLRHLYAAFSNMHVKLSTGPLPTGGYELRARVRLDESRLPAPMRLPTLFSAQWHHDSEWSTWPFEISA